MAKSNNLSVPAVTRVATYSELEHYARAFAAGHLNLVMLTGAAGLGKSQCFRRALPVTVCWIDGNASAFGMYRLAYQHRHQPLVLDDVDGLYQDRRGIRLFKALCQTDLVKTVCWHTAIASGEAGTVPSKFTTTSKVAIIANQWKTLNADVAALQDRGHCLHFAPSALEVHKEAGRWFWDQQVFDFVGAYLSWLQQHSLRSYVLAWELKKAGLDWRQALLSRCLTGLALHVARLKADSSFASDQERARAFVAAGLGCRATFYNHAKKLQPLQQSVKITLVNSCPPQPSAAHEGFLERLRRRFGDLGKG
jgi:hypothetical protein